MGENREEWERIERKREKNDRVCAISFYTTTPGEFSAGRQGEVNYNLRVILNDT